MKVSVNRSRPMLSRGTVKWTGTLPGHTGDYVGIELDVENGKHDGANSNKIVRNSNIVHVSVHFFPTRQHMLHWSLG